MEEKPKNTPADELAERAKAAYQWWDHLATFHPQDPWWLGGLKLLIRAVGIIVLLALSPLLIIVLIITFLTVI